MHCCSRSLGGKHWESLWLMVHRSKIIVVFRLTSNYWVCCELETLCMHLEAIREILTFPTGASRKSVVFRVKRLQTPASCAFLIQCVLSCFSPQPSVPQGSHLRPLSLSLCKPCVAVRVELWSYQHRADGRRPTGNRCDPTAEEATRKTVGLTQIHKHYLKDFKMFFKKINSYLGIVEGEVDGWEQHEA